MGGKGNIFAADPATGTITKFSPLGTRLQHWNGFAGPGSITVDRRGEIYVAHGYTVDTLYGGGGYVATVDTHFVWKGGPAGQSIAVALDPPDHSWYLATECTVGDDCGSVVGTGSTVDRKDALLLLAGGTVRKAWFGLGHTASGQAQETPGMQSREFVTIDAMVNDARGKLYVAGNLWPLGGRQGRGVVAYSPRGARLGLWYLPSQAAVGGIALDGRGTIYVSQAGRVLKSLCLPEKSHRGGRFPRMRQRRPRIPCLTCGFGCSGRLPE